MTRRIGVLCALALALTAAPTASATPPRGEIVIVTDGHATGSITFPVDVDVLASGATYETDSPYVVFGFLRDGAMRAGTDWYDGAGWMFPLVYPGEVPAGAATVRVLTEGPTTICIPVDGLSGTTTVTLTDPLPGAVGEVVDVPYVGTTARSDVAVTVPPDALTLHAYVSGGGTAAGRAQVMCVAALPCATPGCSRRAADRERPPVLAVRRAVRSGHRAASGHGPRRPGDVAAPRPVHAAVLTGARAGRNHAGAGEPSPVHRPGGVLPCAVSSAPFSHCS